jgi:Helix-turn-helix domain
MKTAIKRKGQKDLVLSGRLSSKRKTMLEAVLNANPETLKTLANKYIPESTSSNELVDMSQKDLEQAFELSCSNAGALVREARKMRGFTQRKLANSAKVQNPRVVAVQKSGNQIEVPTLARFADAMGYDVEISFVPREGGQRLVTVIESGSAKNP